MSNEEYNYQSSLKDTLETFFKNPTKENFPDIIQAESEYDDLDFKEKWHEKSKLAKHILAFSNSGGGAIVIGVKQTDQGSFESVGVEDSWDDADFGDKVEKYLPDSSHNIYELEQFEYGDVYDDDISGKTFQVLFIQPANDNAPLVATNAGSNIDDGIIYVRRNTKSAKANYDEVQELLRGRKETGAEKKTVELHEELQELKTLYDEIDKTKTVVTPNSPLANLGNVNPLSSMTEGVENPWYPDESYDDFVSGLIEKKKRRIETRLGVPHMDF